MRRNVLTKTRCLAAEQWHLRRSALRCSGARAGVRAESTSSTSTTAATQTPASDARTSIAADGKRTWSTPLAKQIAEAITITGPLPLAAYMRQCLTAVDGGYYTTTRTPNTDPFGQTGDFVTSPEISQVFGELVGLWVVAEWIAQGRRSEGVVLMEMGPGRGTLMADVLRTIRNFGGLAGAIERVYLVEASETLRARQHGALCGGNEMVETETGWVSRCCVVEGVEVVWCEDIRLVPRDASKSPFIIAHEFFDALPIYVFESTKTPEPQAAPSKITTPTGTHSLNASATGHRTSAGGSRQAGNQWRELLVSPTSPYATHASLKTPKSQRTEPVPEFQLTRAQAPTAHSVYLSETSSRYQALKQTDGAVIEVSPESRTYAADFAVRIGGGTSPSSLYSNNTPDGNRDDTTQPRRRKTGPVSAKRAPERIEKSTPSGAALIIDYGPPNTVPANSLRGIKAHALVSPFRDCGAVDLSADVDFIGLAESALDASEGVVVHGPVDQARFLTAMGIEARAAQLIKRTLDRARAGDGAQSDKKELTELVRRVELGWKRLVDVGPNGMGKLYQVMAIVPYVPPKEGEQIRRPVGFGGDVEF